MGLTASSCGSRLLEDDMLLLQKSCDYTIALAGNPNVGKSTIFNALTGMHQHTGNWPGKTVSNACGTCIHKEKTLLFVDIPGTYSIMSNSQEEEIARDYICFGKPDATVIILDATCIEKNLNLVFQTLEITNKVVVCVNLLDEAKKKHIHIDLEKLSSFLGVPVVGTTARKKKTLNHLLSTIVKVASSEIVCKPNLITYHPIIEDSILMLESKLQNILPKEYLHLSRWTALKLLDGEKTILSSIENHFNISFLDEDLQGKLEEASELLTQNDLGEDNFRDKIVSNIVLKAEDICSRVVSYEGITHLNRDRKIDKILTSKKFGIPIMILFLGIIFWLTITGANYPSSLLSDFFGFLQEKLILLFHTLHAPEWLTGILIEGMFQTVSWVVSVMLPPMAIFFPLFTILEDLGYLPRIAFNLDNYFKKACTTGKQALTMCMGFGCNAAGVVGCRIIDSPRERLIAILTNAFVPCNRKISFSNYGSKYFHWWYCSRYKSITFIDLGCIVGYSTWHLFNISRV